MAGERMLKLPEVALVLGVSLATAERLRATRGFPRPSQYTARSHRWKESEIRRWIEQRKRGK
jgi:predicted DNA-binding transcriptional regulator AlpA